jgi:integrase/recombinase XerC
MTRTASTTHLVARTPTSALAQATAWADLPDDERKRRVSAAARDRDAGALWRLTSAWLTLHGARGGSNSPHTRRAYRAAVLRLLEAWAGEPILRPSRNAGALYARTLEASLARASVVQHIAACRALYAALRWADATDADPWRDVRVTKPEARAAHDRREAFTELEVARMLDEASLVDQVLVLLGARAGLRLAEALALTWSAIDTTAGELRVIAGKGGRDRAVPITADLAEALEAWRPYAPADRVLPYTSQSRARQRLRRVQERAHVEVKPGRAVHSLRHTAGIAVFEASGHDLTVAQGWLGHADVSTTRGYLGRVDALRRRSVAGLLARLPVHANARPVA